MCSLAIRSLIVLTRSAPCLRFSIWQIGNETVEWKRSRMHFLYTGMASCYLRAFASWGRKVVELQRAAGRLVEGPMLSCAAEGAVQVYTVPSRGHDWGPAKICSVGLFAIPQFQLRDSRQACDLRPLGPPQPRSVWTELNAHVLSLPTRFCYLRPEDYARSAHGRETHPYRQCLRTFEN
jgi:hypothetical protein